MALLIQTDAVQVEEKVVQTTLGAVELPIRYRDGALSALFYRVETRLAADLIPGADFVPLTLAGKGLAVLCGFEYRDTSIGLYNEVGLAIWVKRPGAPSSPLRALLNPRKAESQATHIVSLPVTTEKACRLGKELWGFPKYLASIRTDFTGPEARVELEGELAWRQATSWLPRTRGLPFVLFSVNQGRLLRTIVEVDHRVRWGGARRSRLELLGSGPTADKARFLGLDRLRPWAAFRTDNFSSRLPLGKEVGASFEASQAGGERRAEVAQ